MSIRQPGSGHVHWPIVSYRTLWSVMSVRKLTVWVSERERCSQPEEKASPLLWAFSRSSSSPGTDDNCLAEAQPITHSHPPLFPTWYSRLHLQRERRISEKRNKLVLPMLPNITCNYKWIKKHDLSLLSLWCKRNETPWLICGLSVRCKSLHTLRTNKTFIYSREIFFSSFKKDQIIIQFIIKLLLTDSSGSWRFWQQMRKFCKLCAFWCNFVVFESLFTWPNPKPPTIKHTVH